MQVILQGSLRHFPPAELLRFFALGGHGGTLDVQSADGKHARLFLKGGSVIWGEAADAPDLTGVFAITLAVAEGSFTVLDEVVLPEGVSAVPMDIPKLIEAALDRIAAAKSLPDNAFVRVNAEKAQVTMSGDEFKAVLRIGEGKPFSDILRDSGKSRQELTELLRGMEERELIIIQTAATPPPPVSAPEPTRAIPSLKKRARTAALTSDGGDVHALMDDIYTVGRDGEKNDIALPDSSVSTNHAKLTRSGETFVIEDLNSRNGTFVNGEKVAAPKELNDNDVIRFGRVILIFNVAREIEPGTTTARNLNPNPQ